MEYSAPLPEPLDQGYYGFRLESIGGLGANLTGKMLGELGCVYLGFSSSAFSSYGSEKRGSPVKAYVRWSAPEREIRVSSPVAHPHILGLFHEALAGRFPVTAGVRPYTKTVVNTSLSPEEAGKSLRLSQGELFCVDASQIAADLKSRVNMVMLGAMIKASGWVPLEAALQMVRDTVGKKYPAMEKANLSGVQRGWEAASSASVSREGAPAEEDLPDVQAEWGWKNAPIGGMNPRFGSTVQNDLSPSREGYIPLFLQEKCINCGLCDTTCPDMVFQFLPGRYKDRPAMVNSGLDYHHCKGCLRCVEVCPTGALVAGREREHPKKQWDVRNKDLIVQKLRYEEVGANSWVTSESDRPLKRVNGGDL